MKLGSKRTILGAAGATAVAWVASVVLVGGQAAPAGPMAEEVFTNVQVLRGIPVDEFMGTMSFFSSAAGFNCTSCHAEESGGDWARYADDVPLKQTTRQMILMVNAINRANFGGRRVVTCETCHRGSPAPTIMPSILRLYGQPPPDEPGDPFQQAPGQPTPDEVLDRYLDALGGVERLGAITSFVANGTHIGFDDADTVPIEVYARAPDQQTSIVHTLYGDRTTVVDGTSAWVAAPAEERPVPLLTLTGQELDGMRFEAQLAFPARIKELLTDMRVGWPVLIDDREARPVQGVTAGGALVTLCFDMETGLLTRLVRVAESAVGPLRTQLDYSDYRDVSGIQMPFRWSVTWLGGRNRYELSDVQTNVTIEAARFAQPAPSVPPQ